MKVLGKNYYEILDISINATSEQIKSAYRIKIKEYHPDKNGQSQLSIAISQDLNEILDILSNSLARKEYDQNLSSGTTVKVVYVEKEPLAKCIKCHNPLDASWKTYCNFHYREYLQGKAEFGDDEGEGICQECGNSTNASWKTYCTNCYRERMNN